MESLDNVVSVITWLFLEILSDVHHFTRNTNLSTSYKEQKIYKLEVDKIIDQLHLSKCITVRV